jgi:purine-nucleoside phosphorylase
MHKTVDFIKKRTNIQPEIGIILGSGLGTMANEIEGVKIPYSEIPNFCTSTIEGHAGQLVIGNLEGKRVIAMQGRFHFYEGYAMKDVVMPIRVMKKLGVSKLIVTNAAGGINKEFNAGDLMLIKDHINFMGNNPLIGKNDTEYGVRFPDMSEAYKKYLIEIAKDQGQKLGIELKEGIYVACTGPSYETPAEINMFRLLGADVVGMSTAPEVIVANHTGIDVLGISCVTNMAAGVLNQSLSHDEVIETSRRIKKDFVALIKGIIKAL